MGCVSKGREDAIHFGKVMLITLMKIFKWVPLAIVLIQFIPFGHSHTNLRIQGARVNSPQTRELIHRACFDCHSNENWSMALVFQRRSCIVAVAERRERRPEPSEFYRVGPPPKTRQGWPSR